MKRLTIENCNECPFVDHKGGFGNVAYIPVCKRVGRKELPYTEHASNGRITARCTGVIPEWCPLEDA